MAAWLLVLYDLLILIAQGELDPPTSIIGKDYTPQTCLQVNLMKSLFQLRSLFTDTYKFVSG